MIPDEFVIEYQTFLREKCELTMNFEEAKEDLEIYVRFFEAVLFPQKFKKMDTN